MLITDNILVCLTVQITDYINVSKILYTLLVHYSPCSTRKLGALLLFSIESTQM